MSKNRSYRMVKDRSNAGLDQLGPAHYPQKPVEALPKRSSKRSISERSKISATQRKIKVSLAKV